MADLVRYDAMCTAIAECHQIDEVKDLRDKAMALELYAKQARNTDAERRASEIRLRAERRTGELLKELARATAPNTAGANQHQRLPASNAGNQTRSPYRAAIEQAQIPERTAQRYQALADVPKAVFEEAVRDPESKPTTTGLLAKAQAMRTVNEARDPVPKMPSDTLWLWGRMRDFERDGFFDKDHAKLLGPLTETMRADVLRLAPLMTEFFTRLEEAIHEHA